MKQLLIFLLSKAVLSIVSAAYTREVDASIGDSVCLDKLCDPENQYNTFVVFKNNNNTLRENLWRNSSDGCNFTVSVERKTFEWIYLCTDKEDDVETARLILKLQFVEITAKRLQQEFEEVDSPSKMKNLTKSLSHVKERNLSPNNMSDFSTLLKNISEKSQFISTDSVSDILKFVDSYLNVDDKATLYNQNITSTVCASMATIAKDFKLENGLYEANKNNIKLTVSSLQSLDVYDSSILLDTPNKEELSATEVLFSKKSINSSNPGDKERISIVVYKKDKLFPGQSGSTLSDVVEVIFSSEKPKRVFVDANNTVKIRFIRPTLPHSSECVFWDYSLNSFRGGWSSQGCHPTISSPPDHILCECSHLTSFAIFFHVDPEALAFHQDHLSHITKAGCIISLICISITFLTYILVRKWRTPPKKPLLHLCIALFITLFTFLIGFNNTKVPFLCATTAVVLHYSILAVFLWILAKVLLVFTCVVKGKPLTEIISQFLFVMTLASWGIPLFSVICTLAYDASVYNGYKDLDYCWMTRDVFLYTFGIPLFCTIAMTLITFVIVAVKVWKLSKDCLLTVELMEDLKYHTWMTFGLLVLTCFSWTCGFMLYWMRTSVTLAYIFSILGAFQGFFLFIFTVTVDYTSRVFWKTFIYIIIFGDSETTKSTATNALIQS